MKECFLIMPYREKYEFAYEEICSVASRFNIKIIRADKDFLSYPVMETIVNKITESEYVIAILGDNENANVFYELGISHSKKPFSKVLIFKDDAERYTFDIQHIKQFTFTVGNREYINEIATRFFKTNTDEYSLENVLARLPEFERDKQIYDVLVAYLKQYHELICDEIAKILSRTNYTNNLVHVVESVKNFVFHETSSPDSTLGVALIYLYAEIIVKTHNNLDYKNEINLFLTNEKILNEYKIVFTIFLVNKELFVKDCIQWQLDYFGSNDMHRVDLNRYRIEAFLLESRLQAVSDALIEALSASNAHKREYCAEIIRAKKLCSATEKLLLQLKREEDFYAARSIIDALVEIEKDNSQSHSKCMKAIENYASKHKYDNDSFIARHIRNALTTFVPKCSE